MDSLTPRWRQRGWRPPMDLPTRAIDITAWQFVDTICLCCLTHGVCVSHWTQPLLTTGRQRLLEYYHLSMPSPWPVARDGPACVHAACLYIIARPDSQFLCTQVYFFFVITHRSTVLSILITNLINRYISLTIAPNMPCTLLVMTSYFAHVLNSYSGCSLYWRVVFILLSASNFLAFNPLSSSNCAVLFEGGVFGNAIVCWPDIFYFVNIDRSRAWM